MVQLFFRDLNVIIISCGQVTSLLHSTTVLLHKSPEQASYDISSICDSYITMTWSPDPCLFSDRLHQHEGEVGNWVNESRKTQKCWHETVTDPQGSNT